MDSNQFQENLTKLEKAICYKFNDISLVREALTHPSLRQIKHSQISYERFELFGDSILGFLITEIIFHKFLSYNEGQLAKMKAHLASHEILSKIAQELDLGNYLIMTSGEEKSGGRSNRNNMENALEALIASVYLDSNMENARKIVELLWSEHTENVDFTIIDPKSYLQELSQEKLQIMPTYSLTGQEGLVHAPIFKVEVKAGNHFGESTGKSIKEAEKNAARILIKKLHKVFL